MEVPDRAPGAAQLRIEVVAVPVAAGTLVGRFVIHEYLGEGSLGTSFRAFERDLGSVLIKVLTRLSSPEARQAFRMMAPRLVQVRHPGLVRVLSHGEHGDVPYLVEDYVPATTLADRLRRAPMLPTRALEVLRGLARALDRAHESGLVHGSLRPSQVLMAPERALITDFGLAEASRSPADAGPSPAADRYAFAAIAYELLVDRPPSPLDGEAELATPSQVMRTLPKGVDTVLLKGLSEAPESRWETAGALVDALVNSFEPEPAMEPALEWPIQRRLLAPIAAGACAALVFTVTAVGIQFWRPQHPPAIHALRVRPVVSVPITVTPTAAPVPLSVPTVQATLPGPPANDPSPDTR